MALGESTIAALNEISATPLTLYQVEVSDSTTWYLTNNIEAVIWLGQVYTPFPITHDAVDVGAQEDAQLNVTVCNINKAFRDALRANEMRNRKVTIIEVLAEGLADTVPHLQETLWITRYQINRYPAAVVFTLTQEPNIKIPTQRVTRERFPFVPRGGRTYFTS